MSVFWFAGGFGELVGEGPVVDLARAELGADPVPEARPAFRLEVRERPASMPEGPSFGGVTDLGEGFRVHRERMDLDIEIRLDQGRVDAVLSIGSRGPSLGIPKPVYPMVDRAGMTWEANHAYHVVTLLEVLALYNGAAAVLHASVVESGGSGLALTSAGGVGKTSTACSLVLGHGFRHLADDIALIGDDGTTLRSRAPIDGLPVQPGSGAESRGLLRRGGESAGAGCVARRSTPRPGQAAPTDERGGGVRR